MDAMGTDGAEREERREYALTASDMRATEERARGAWCTKAFTAAVEERTRRAVVFMVL